MAPPGSAGAGRYHRSLLSSVGLLAARIASAAAAIVTVPILIGHLGPQRYGLVVTATASAALLAVLDMGLPGALVGALAEAQAVDDRARAGRLVSTAAFLLLAVAGLGWLLVTGGALARRRLAASLGLADDTLLVVLLLLGGFFSWLPVSVADATWRGLQRGYRASLWQAASTGLTLSLLWGVTTAGMGIVAVGAVYAVAPLVGSSLSALDLFGRFAPWLRPRPGLVGLGEARELRARAGPLLRLQWAGVINNQSDSLVIAGLAGLGQAAAYAVTVRLFLPLQALAGMLLQPLWPAYAEASALRQRAWALRTLKGSTLLAAALAVVPSLVLALFGQDIVRLWVGAAVDPPPRLLAAYAAWTSLACLTLPFGLYVVGTGFTRGQARLALAGAALNVALSIALVPRIGPAGAVWSSVLCQGLFMTLPAVLETRRRLRLPEPEGRDPA